MRILNIALAFNAALQQTTVSSTTSNRPNLLLNSPIAPSGRVTPILIAAMNGRLDIVRRLAEGADALPDTLESAMIFAAAYDQLDVVEYLLERDGNLANARNNGGFSDSVLSTNPDWSFIEMKSPYALTMACSRGYLDVVSKLLQHGARFDYYALAGACRGGHTEIVKLLIDHGADVNEVDHDFERYSPISLAILSGKVEVVDLLVRHGATRGLNEALMLHGIRGDFMLTKFLLESGADPNFASQSLQSTRLMIAVLDYRSDMVRLLLDHGADLRPDRRGITPLNEFINRCDPRDYNLAPAKGMQCHKITDAFVEAGFAKNFRIPPHTYVEITERLLLGGAANTVDSDAVYQELMRPITEIKSMLSGSTGTDAIGEALSEYGASGLLTLAFQARKEGIDVLSDAQFGERWTERRIRMLSSIISQLVLLECTDLNFYYVVAHFLADADEDMLQHAETAFKFLAGSLGVHRSRDGIRTTNGAILNEMIERSGHYGLRPVVKAIFALYHEESQLVNSARPWGFRQQELPDVLVDLVMSHDDRLSSTTLKARAMHKLMQAIRRLRPLDVTYPLY